MKSYITVLCFMLAHCATFAQAGKVFRESHCASGGNDYYFFANGDVVVVDAVAGDFTCESVSVGTWGLNGDKNSVDVALLYTKSLKPAPGAKIQLPVGAKETYDKYVVAYTKEDGKPKAISLPTDNDGCEVYENHSYRSASEIINKCFPDKGKK